MSGISATWYLLRNWRDLDKPTAANTAGILVCTYLRAEGPRGDGRWVPGLPRLAEVARRVDSTVAMINYLRTLPADEVPPRDHPQSQIWAGLTSPSFSIVQATLDIVRKVRSYRCCMTLFTAPFPNTISRKANHITLFI